MMDISCHPVNGSLPSLLTCISVEVKWIHFGIPILLLVLIPKLVKSTDYFCKQEILTCIFRFLGCVNLLGTTYECSTIATGYGAYLAQPILREAVEGKEDTLTESEAQAILEKCMTVLWYRDARSTDEIRMAKVTSSGVTITEPFIVSQNWAVAKYQFN